MQRETLPQLAGVLLLVLPTGLPEGVRWQVGRLAGIAALCSVMDGVSGVQGRHTHLPLCVLHAGNKEGEAGSFEAVVPAQVKSSHCDGNGRLAGR
jgi:hypothetical protein